MRAKTDDHHIEFGVRNHHDNLRRLLPVLECRDKVPEDRVASLNEELLGEAATPRLT